MAKSKINIFVLIGAVTIILFLGVQYFSTQSILGTETMERDIPNLIAPGASFIVNYKAIGVSGKWGVIIEDNLEGGCKFPSGSTKYSAVMLSDEGTTKQITVTSPTTGSCKFTGTYMYDETRGEISFPAGIVEICKRNTDADTDCSNSVSKAELVIYINKWVDNSITKVQLIKAITAWAAGG